MREKKQGGEERKKMVMIFFWFRRIAYNKKIKIKINLCFHPKQNESKKEGKEDKIFIVIAIY